MNILHIEDDIMHRQRVKDGLSDEFNPFIVSCDFDDYSQYLESFNTDIIILDLSRDQTGDTEPGEISLEKIWGRAFCPIIIFSAFADENYTNKYSDMYFVRRVLKGTGEIERLVSTVKELSGFIKCKNEISKLLNSHISETYKTVFPSMLNNIGVSDQIISDVFNRLIRRRIAAAIDETTDSSPIESWEMYLFPPISNQIFSADILYKKDEDKDKPESYKIILSPSCDLYKDESKKRKPLEKILVAFCVNIDLYLKSKNLPKGTTEQKIKDYLPKFLSNTNAEKYIPLPELKGLLPHMACDFKQLEMIEYEKIGEDKEYNRIASIDSPFREAIIWAYMQVNCRPGLPDRNFDLWTQQIWNEISK